MECTLIINVDVVEETEETLGENSVIRQRYYNSIEGFVWLYQQSRFERIDVSFEKITVQLNTITKAMKLIEHLNANTAKYGKYTYRITDREGNEL